MVTIADRLHQARARVDAACHRAGREPASVELLPISKWHSPASIREAHAAGWTRLGESRPQELRSKAEELDDVELSWVAIGHLQTNKAKIIAAYADEFQALDSVPLGQALDRRLAQADRELPVLLEVNTSGEAAKGGFAPEGVVDAVRMLRSCDRLRLEGLMTLAARSQDQEPVRACFTRLVETQQRLQDTFGEPFDTLSMGMSEDFELAVACGSTCVRLGTLIFGPRPTR